MKRKFEKVSNPSQVAKLERGSGKIAIMMKAIGNNNQATELLMDIELRLRKTKIKINSAIAAIVISI